MSINTYDEITGELEERLRTLLTAETLESVNEIVREVMTGYEINRIVKEEEGKDFMMEAFLDALKVEGKSEKTIVRYKYVICRMLQKMEVTSKNITTYQIRKYLSEEKDRGISESTIKGCRAVFSSYFNWLHREDLIEKNPMRNIGQIKCQKKVKKVFSQTDIERMKWGCKTPRDRAIVCFLKATGCRISEMTSLNREDVNLEKRECTVLGKGNKERTVYLDPVAAMTLKDYLDGRKDDEKPLFLNKRRERFQPGGVRYMLKQLGIQEGIEHVHPHKFRRTEATMLIKHGMAIQEVARILGHEKLDTTMDYVVLDQVDVKNSYQKYS